MKKILKFLPLLLLAVVFTSCNKNGIDNKVKGNYTFTDDALSINSVPTKANDYPKASASISAKGDNLVEVNLINIIPGYDSYALTAEAATTKADGSYSVSGTNEDDKIAVGISGVIENSKLTLSINYIKKDDVVGKWMFNAADLNGSKLPDVYFTLNTDVETITIFGEKLPIKTVVALANQTLMNAAAKAPIDFYEFTTSGFFNLDSPDAETMAKLSLINNRLESYVSEGNINFFLRNSSNEILTTLLAKYGFTFSINISFAIPYTITDGIMNLEINKTTLSPAILLLDAKLPTFTYAVFKKIAPNSEITENMFTAYKAIATDVLSIITSNKTTLTLGCNLIKFDGSTRPWAQAN